MYYTAGMSSTPRLTTADLDRLESLLSAEHLKDSMTLDALQGLFCAVASAPAPIAQPEWLAAALGEHAFASDDEAKEVTDLLTRFCNDTARDLAAEEGLDVISYPAEEGEEELAVWCEGYLVGVALAEPDWFAAGDEEMVDELLFPFMALSGRLKEHALEAGEPWEEGEAEAKLMNEARESFYETLEEAWKYWFEGRINRVPQKREAVKVGRNDPCPCGSGRKYKACHGAG
jgi:uncharacterized protein